MQSRQRFFTYKLAVPIVAFIIITFFFTGFTVIAISTSMAVIQNSGRVVVVGLDAYGGDLNTVGDAFSISLGELQVGTSKNASFFLRNVSNMPITIAFNVSSWEPYDLKHFMFISWNYNGKQISPNEEIPIKINVNAPLSEGFVDYVIANRVASFSFSITIYTT